MIDKELHNDGRLIGYAYVPFQIAEETNLYDAQMALDRGTIFPPLDLPLGVYGRQLIPKEENCYE
jgi:hypothetical protein